MTIPILLVGAYWLAPGASVAAVQEPQAPAASEVEVEGSVAGAVDGTAELLFDPWLRRESVVLDVEWYGDQRLVTLDADGFVTAWRLDEQAVGLEAQIAGVVELVTATDGTGAPLGLALAYGGEQARIEFRESADRPPTWSLPGLRGPIAIGPASRRLLANDGERLVSVELSTGELRSVFELGGWSVADVAYAGDELAVLLINRAKVLGRAGTEYEATATMVVMGFEQFDRRELVEIDVEPCVLTRLGERWIALDRAGRIVSQSAERGGPVELFETPILCADLGGRELSAIGVDGRWLRTEGLGLGVQRGPFVGVGAREIERSPDGLTYAVPDGTTVRLIGADGTDRGGARGPGARVSSIEFHPGGNHLLIGSYDHTVRVVALEPTAEIAFEPTDGIVHRAVFSATARDRGYAWVARGGRIERRVDDWPGNPRALELSAEDPGLAWSDLGARSNGLFAVLASGQLIAFDPTNLRRRWTVGGVRGERPRLAAAADSIAVGGSGLFHFRAADGERLGRIEDLGAPVESLALAADGARGVLGLANGAVSTFELEQPRLIETVARHLGRVEALALDADGRWVASIGTHDSALTLTQLDPSGASLASRTLPWSGPTCTALAWWERSPAPDPNPSDGNGADRAERTGPTRLLAAGRQDGAVLLFSFDD